jgi:hypothetical protein
VGFRLCIEYGGRRFSARLFEIAWDPYQRFGLPRVKDMTCVNYLFIFHRSDYEQGVIHDRARMAAIMAGRTSQRFGNL